LDASGKRIDDNSVRYARPYSYKENLQIGGRAEWYANVYLAYQSLPSIGTMKVVIADYHEVNARIRVILWSANYYPKLS
jgi:hypothetical protein